MRKLLLILMTVGLVSCAKTEYKEVFPGVKALIHRVVPQIESSIIIDSIAGENGKDVFEIYSEGDKIILAGSSPVAAASALNWYLKYYCHCHFARVGNNMDLPKELPVVKEKVRISSPYKTRYWLNYCTFNYTMSFWGWEQWQRELDWMAMQGINLVLAINGSEEVWQNTMKKWNMSDKDISNFICGPGYQAWWLMGNLEGWGGPVSQEWIKSRTALQKNILAYLKEMQMEPVFQGFYGMVPTSLKAQFPKADIRSTGEWNAFIRPDFIMPTDSMFHVFAQNYYQELEKLYGKAKYYGGDPFHEGAILNVDLTACGANIQKEMQLASEGSTWVLQGWIGNPAPKLLAGLDKDKTLVLDLFGETLADWNKFEPSWKISNGYSGCRWIWCTVTNFGGRNGLHGKIDSTTNILNEARKSAFGNRLEGIGVMPEGSHINPFMFDYFFELGWRNELPQPVKWAEEYSVFRYGKDLPNARQAWNIFSRTVYNIPMRFDEPQSILCAKPSVNVVKAAPWGMYPIHYDHKRFVEGVKLLLTNSEELKTNDAYLYDVADMTRQSILGELEYAYKSIVQAIHKKDKTAFKEGVEKFISLAKDEERLVATRPEFLLGRWISSARNIAPTETEKDLFEQNARMLITTWGYGAQHKTLYDYTHHEWAGLIGTYYLPRWIQFFSDQDKILNGQKIVPYDYDAFEEEWTKKHEAFPVEPVGNTIEIANDILKKYFN